MLTPVAFARGFLHGLMILPELTLSSTATEAIVEGLKREYGGGELWTVMVNNSPNQFSGEYPNTDETRSLALKNFKPTKQDREEEWIVNNSQNPQAKLRMSQLAEYLYDLNINFPTVLWDIVAEYATVPSWIDVE